MLNSRRRERSSGFFSVQKSQWLILHSFHPSSCPVIHGLRRGPHLPGEINSDFNCVDVSNSLLPTRTNFHPLRCQMALNISANHGSTRGELKEMGSEWRVRRALRCGDGMQDPSYPLSLTPATLHTCTLWMVIYVLNRKTWCVAPTVAFISITSMIKALKEHTLYFQS